MNGDGSPGVVASAHLDANGDAALEIYGSNFSPNDGGSQDLVSISCLGQDNQSSGVTPGLGLALQVVFPSTTQINVEFPTAGANSLSGTQCVLEIGIRGSNVLQARAEFTFPDLPSS